MADPTYPLFPIFAFLGFVVGFIPLPWHVQAWNSGTCLFMIWSSLSCLIQFVNSIIWNNNLRDTAPIWCDISTKFIVGAGVGIPASSLCINRRLYSIAAVQHVSITRDDRKRNVIIDLCISVGIPVLVMILHYIVQGHRFNILEDVGCLPEIFNTPPAYPLVFIWPVVLGCVSFVYAALTLRAFWKRRLQFSELLSSSTAMTVNRYFRLMLLACLEMMLTVPLSSFSIYINTHGLTLSPWISWEDTHFNFSHVEHIPAAIWRYDIQYRTSVEMSRWIYPFSAFLFFALFGFAEEARRNYARAFQFITRLAGIRPKPRSSPGKSLSGSQSLSQPFQADISLPPYSPRKVQNFLTRSQSLASTSSADLDIEKGKGAYSFPSTPIDTEASSPTVCNDPRQDDSMSVPSHRIIISDEHPPSTPPTPILEPFASNSPISPPYYRPFTRPTVQPIPPSHPPPSNVIVVTIHTESTRESN